MKMVSLNQISHEVKWRFTFLALMAGFALIAAILFHADRTKTAILSLMPETAFNKANKYIKKDLLLFIPQPFPHRPIERASHTCQFQINITGGLGQTGTSDHQRILAPKILSLSNKLSFPCTKWRTLRKGWHRSLPLKFRALQLVHASKCFGYRFEIDGKIISYCTDTGYCKNSAELSWMPIFLSLMRPAQRNKHNDFWPHWIPTLAAKTCDRIKAKKTCSYSFWCALYTTPTKRDKAQAHARRIFPETISAYDGLRIKFKWCHSCAEVMLQLFIC